MMRLYKKDEFVLQIHLFINVFNVRKFFCLNRYKKY